MRSRWHLSTLTVDVSGRGALVTTAHHPQHHDADVRKRTREFRELVLSLALRVGARGRSEEFSLGLSTLLKPKGRRPPPVGDMRSRGFVASRGGRMPP